jgi:hypothetical protein
MAVWTGHLIQHILKIYLSVERLQLIDFQGDRL